MIEWIEYVIELNWLNGMIEWVEYVIELNWLNGIGSDAAKIVHESLGPIIGEKVQQAGIRLGRTTDSQMTQIIVVKVNYDITEFRHGWSRRFELWGVIASTKIRIEHHEIGV